MHPVNDIYIIDTTNTNPYINLAMEEYLYEHFIEGTAILFLWQNANTIVIGQNQSAYSQCEISEVKKAGTHIARRRSGGGAVYHDLGNLNYTFISQNKPKVCADNFNIIVQMLKDVGLDAEFSGRNDILIDGKKVSGNAFLCDDKKMCHHGTLLVDSDQDMMYRLLRIDNEKWKDKGIKSAKGRTENLKHYLPNVSVDLLKDLLKKEFCSFYSGATIHEGADKQSSLFDKEELEKLVKKYSSREWIFEKQFEENLHIQKRFNWGQITILMNIRKNIIEEIAFLSDAMDTAIIENITQRLEKASFCVDSILNVFTELEERYESNQILRDIKDMLIVEVPENKR